MAVSLLETDMVLLKRCLSLSRPVGLSCASAASAVPSWLGLRMACSNWSALLTTQCAVEVSLLSRKCLFLAPFSRKDFGSDGPLTRAMLTVSAIGSLVWSLSGGVAGRVRYLSTARTSSTSCGLRFSLLPALAAALLPSLAGSLACFSTSAVEGAFSSPLHDAYKVYKY